MIVLTLEKRKKSVESVPNEQHIIQTLSCGKSPAFLGLRAGKNHENQEDFFENWPYQEAESDRDLFQ